MASEQKYTAADIKVLPGLEAIRKRPSMYIGGTGSGGLHNLVFVALEPAIEEAQAGFATLVNVTLNADSSIAVEHNGHAVPIAPHRETGVPHIEIIMTELHAGGTTWGVYGLVIVNALSSRADLTAWDNGTEYAIAFENGERVAALQAVGEAAGRRGTRITFAPSPEIFITCEFDFEAVCRKLRGVAPQCPNTSFVLEDLRQVPPKRVELSPNA